jgi:hypothetical protein
LWTPTAHPRPGKDGDRTLQAHTAVLGRSATPAAGCARTDAQCDARSAMYDAIAEAKDARSRAV